MGRGVGNKKGSGGTGKLVTRANRNQSVKPKNNITEDRKTITKDEFLDMLYTTSGNLYYQEKEGSRAVMAITNPTDSPVQIEIASGQIVTGEKQSMLAMPLAEDGTWDGEPFTIPYEDFSQNYLGRKKEFMSDKYIFRDLPDSIEEEKELIKPAPMPPEMSSRNTVESETETETVSPSENLSLDDQMIAFLDRKGGTDGAETLLKHYLDSDEKKAQQDKTS